jgi:TPP-dependent pyruvate/acetoin dehydrogenase alpha subunit
MKIELYKQMLLIRIFEEKVLELFSKGKLNGTTHAYIGQEANAVGVISNLLPSDIVVSNHRCHGHYLTHKKNPYALICEMMGKEDGLCSGRGGSQHIYDEGFFSNGVQGGILPLSAGLAFSEKFNNSENIVVVFIGDGTLGEGAVYESLNIVSKWKLPLLIVVENNLYAQSTKIENTLAGKISNRFTAFNISTIELDTFDVSEIKLNSNKLIQKIRRDKKPRCLVINTYRFASHSKSDDGRDQGEVKKWMLNDPLLVLEKNINDKILNEIKKKTDKYLSNQINKALKAKMAR